MSDDMDNWEDFPRGRHAWAERGARGKHAARAPYYGDEFSVETVGEPSTELFGEGADRTPRRAGSHATPEYTVETVGQATQVVPVTQSFDDFSGLDVLVGPTVSESFDAPARGKAPAHVRAHEMSAQEMAAWEAARARSRGQQGAQEARDGRTRRVAPVQSRPQAPVQATSRSGRHAAPSSQGPRDPQGPRGPQEPRAFEPVKTRSRGRTALKAVAVVLVLAIVAILAGGFIYAQRLDSALKSAEGASAQEALVAAKSGEPFYVLVLGSDSREGSGTSTHADEQGDNQRSDVMILVRVDLANSLLTMVSIPRDTPYTAPDGTLTKINEAYNIGGAAESIRAVAELTGVPISHYAAVHISDMQNIVDALGGVTVDVNNTLTVVDALTGETIVLEPGVQVLNGQQAQAFARARHEYMEDQDANRQSNVRTLAMAIIKQVLDRPVAEIPGTVLELAQYVQTDVRTATLLSAASKFVLGSGDLTIYSGTGPTDGGVNEEAGGQWLCYPNPEGWAYLMSVVDSGGDPAGITY